MAGLMGMQLAGLGVLAAAPTVVGALVYVALFGAGSGTQTIMRAALLAERYGSINGAQSLALTGAHSGPDRRRSARRANRRIHRAAVDPHGIGSCWSGGCVASHCLAVRRSEASLNDVLTVQQYCLIYHTELRTIVETRYDVLRQACDLFRQLSHFPR
jgi:hypothetical protein